MVSSSLCWGRPAPAKPLCLRLIAGFEQLSGGAISIFGTPASNLPPWGAGREYCLPGLRAISAYVDSDNVALTG